MKLNLKVFEDQRIKLKGARQEECGVTQISLENAYYLLSKYGEPYSVDLTEEDGEWYVTVAWHVGVEMTDQKFSGFSWGYNGEGPRGLKTLMKALGMEEKDGWTPYKDLPKITTKLGFSASQPSWRVYP